MGTGYRAMECARVAGADFCALALTSSAAVAANGVAESRLLITRDGWATSAVLTIAAAAGSARATAVYPSLLDSGPTTSAAALVFGGVSATLLRLQLDASLALTRLHPPAPRTGGLDMAFFDDGSCLLVGTDVFTACAPAGRLTFSAATTGAALTAAALNSTYPTRSAAVLTAAAIFSPSSWLAAGSALAPASTLNPSTPAQTHTAWLTTDAGASFALICTVYTPAGNAAGKLTPGTRQVKLVYTRASNTAAAATAVYIVHPFIVYAWAGSVVSGNCGTSLATLAPPSIAGAASTPVDVPMAVALGCSPDAARGCFLLKASLTQADAAAFLFADWTPVASVSLHADCGVPGSFSGAAVASADLTFAASQGSNIFFGAAADVIFGSASAGLAFAAVPGALFLTANGASWATCSLASSSCVGQVLDTSGGSGQMFVSAAAFSNASLAYAYVSDAGYVVSAGPARLLRFAFRYAAGVGAVTGTVVSIGAAAGSTGAALLLPASGYLVNAFLMATQPRFFPVTDASGATGCAALPSGYTPPAIAPQSPTQTPSVSPSPAATPSVSPSAAATPSDSASPSQAASQSVSPSGSGSATRSASLAASSRLSLRSVGPETASASETCLV
jgi:hypothetical protein